MMDITEAHKQARSAALTKYREVRAAGYTDVAAVPDAFNAGLAAMERAGFVMAPTVPTPDMMEHYMHAFVSEKRFDGSEVYAAMISARPRVQP